MVVVVSVVQVDGAAADPTGSSATARRSNPADLRGLRSSEPAPPLRGDGPPGDLRRPPAPGRSWSAPSGEVDRIGEIVEERGASSRVNRVRHNFTVRVIVDPRTGFIVTAFIEGRSDRLRW
jgi:hypothetical protein